MLRIVVYVVSVALFLAVAQLVVDEPWRKRGSRERAGWGWVPLAPRYGRGGVPVPYRVVEPGGRAKVKGALLLLVAGLVGLIVGIVWSVRAIRQGRAVAIAPLLLDGFLVFHGLVAMLAAFSLF
jgi:hypothetical protein